MKKIVSALLSVMLCMSVMVLAPDSRWAAPGQPDEAAPCVDEDGGDDF